MELHERRLAQIVRDFMEAYVLATRIQQGLQQGDLRFSLIERLVGDRGDSALYRLKEESHALFRLDQDRSETDIQAEQLFDLAVGALFHESMKFREGFYLTTSYGPRLERMMAEGSASGSLAEAFRRTIDAGSKRMLESSTEVGELFPETRDQLLTVLGNLPESGAVARGLVEDPARTEAVFMMPLDHMLEQVYGSAQHGYQLAIENTLANGHFAEAEVLLQRDSLRGSEFVETAAPFAQGMARYYTGDVPGAMHALDRWVDRGAPGMPGWRHLAGRVLNAISTNVDDELDASVREAAGRLGERLPTKNHPPDRS